MPLPWKAGSARLSLAAGVAEVGVAAVLEEAALGLLQIVSEAAHFGGEGVAERRTSPMEPERISTRWLVSAQLTPDLDRRVVEQAGGEVVLVRLSSLSALSTSSCRPRGRRRP